MKVKLATWNMAYWSHKKHSKDAWIHLVNQTDCDILLFQESFPDFEILNPQNLVWNAIGGSRLWGSGIYSHVFPVREYFHSKQIFLVLSLLLRLR